MKKCNSQQSLALIALVAVVGGYIGAATSSAYVVNSDVQPPSSRAEQQDNNIHRDIATELRLQERLLTELRAEQEAERVHAAAPEAVDEAQYYDYRDHYRMYRRCTRLGYTRNRLSECIISMLETGEYSGT
ncbi:MAG: hypothetical protein HOG89_00495 [Candidatus Peribacter sp.]|jgi:hypothetical protein|nr:hypothetical protein [Candidatus Peribacter sp.]MBT4392995.1 hypothetical protein [Candidatus Peribacter sp.]MBT4601055.1 hypothetical protein [Candidatus Peribacter sp.]MBT5149583.1 hypothetical protein [Candidatus Peribacter sp.]MBT5637457.1 hypothetical protein [Candidatus Peribacter sp.]